MIIVCPLRFMHSKLMAIIDDLVQLFLFIVILKAVSWTTSKKIKEVPKMGHLMPGSDPPHLSAKMLFFLTILLVSSLITYLLMLPQTCIAELKQECGGLEATEEGLEVAEKELHCLNERRDHVYQLWEIMRVMTQTGNDK